VSAIDYRTLPGFTGRKQRKRLPVQQKNFLAFPVDTTGLLTAHVRVKDQSMALVVDTGASQCLMTRGFYDNLPYPRPTLIPTRHKFTVANGDTMPAAGVCHLKFFLAGEWVTYLFYVSDCKDSLALLGLPYLDEKYASVHTRRKQLRYEDGRTPVALFYKRAMGSYILRSQTKVSVPARSHCVLQTDVDSIEFNASIEGQSILCLPSSELWDNWGVEVIDGLTFIYGGSSKIGLFNPFDIGVTIPKGCIIGEAEKCSRPITMVNCAEEDVDPQIMKQYALQCETNLENDQRMFGAFAFTKEERDLYRLAGEDPIDPDSDEADSSEIRDNSYNDVMCPPIAEGVKPLRRPGEVPHHLTGMYDREIIGNQNLSEGFRNKVKRALIDREKSFYDPTEPISQTDYANHYIDVGSSNPVSSRPRRIPIGMKDIVEEEIEKMLRDKIIGPSESPWASPIVLVKKKDGTIRFCVDYREINEVTKKDAYPLPRIDDYLDSFHGMDTFCVLDLASGYWQVKMAQMDRCKTAFTSHRGLYQFNVMPFGLCNAPGTFQRMMDRLLKTKEFKGICLVYLDDIIIFGKGNEECLRNLIKVMDAIEKAGLKLKPKKCSLFQKSVNFLGHIVTADGVRTDPEKIAKVSLWPTPSRVGHVRSFMGLACYYQRFIQDFADKAKPLNNLIGKNSLFQWGEAEQGAFQTLKDALTNTPVLACPEKDGKWILDTDASKVAMGAVLSQVQIDGTERVIAYGSKTFNTAQVNYCTTKRELLAVVYFATNKFRHYLAMQDFVVRSDHAALTWLKNFDDHDPITSRWRIALNQFGSRMKIEYRKGSAHGNADALSRSATRLCRFEHCKSCLTRRKEKAARPVKKRVEEYHTICRTTGQFIPEEEGGYTSAAFVFGSLMAEEEKEPMLWECPHLSAEQIRGAQEDDPDIGQVLEFKLTQTNRPKHKALESLSYVVKRLCTSWDRLIVKEGVLYIKSQNDDSVRLVAPIRFRSTILDQLHATDTAGHPGIVKTCQEIRRRFFWVGMKDDVYRWVKCCRICATHKRGPPRNRAPLTQELTGHRNERMAFDIIGPLPTTRKGNRFILLMVDYFTKWVEVSALETHTAKVVSKEILDKWVTRFGVPWKLHCDQAPEFNSACMTEFGRLIKTCKTRTLPYRPCSNGLCEKSNQTIEGILRCLCDGNREDWDEHLQMAVMAYRASPHGTTGCSPNLMIFGQENYMPIDLMFKPPMDGELWSAGCKNKCTCDYIDWLRSSIQESYARAREMTRQSALRQKRGHDVNVRIQTFERGDWVMHWHKPTALRTLSQGWRSPLVILRRIDAVNYEVQEAPGIKPRTIHIDNLILDIVRPWRPNWIRAIALPKPDFMKTSQTRAQDRLDADPDPPRPKKSAVKVSASGPSKRPDADTPDAETLVKVVNLEERIIGPDKENTASIEESADPVKDQTNEIIVDSDLAHPAAENPKPVKRKRGRPAKNAKRVVEKPHKSILDPGTRVSPRNRKQVVHYQGSLFCLDHQDVHMLDTYEGSCDDMEEIVVWEGCSFLE
jgi:hypothetical protein